MSQLVNQKYNLNTTVPYFYIIRHIHTNIMYAGSRWKENCNPSEFMKIDGYTTTSKKINTIIENEGLGAFEILRIDTNLDGYTAFEYEIGFLAAHNCRKSSEWYNGGIPIKKTFIDKKVITKELPSHKYLNECFVYNPETGECFWKVRPLHHFGEERKMKAINTHYAGKLAGSITKVGYIRVKINKQLHPMHRIIYKMQTGMDPEYIIDHINGNRLDNRWSNLRSVTISQNNCNATIQSNNTSGYAGVCWCKRAKLWKAYIKFQKVRYHLGYFSNKEDAAEAYRKKALELHGEFSIIHRL